LKILPGGGIIALTCRPCGSRLFLFELDMDLLELAQYDFNDVPTDSLALRILENVTLEPHDVVVVLGKFGMEPHMPSGKNSVRQDIVERISDERCGLHGSPLPKGFPCFERGNKETQETSS